MIFELAGKYLPKLQNANLSETKSRNVQLLWMTVWSWLIISIICSMILVLGKASPADYGIFIFISFFGLLPVIAIHKGLYLLTRRLFIIQIFMTYILIGFGLGESGRFDWLLFPFGISGYILLSKVGKSILPIITAVFFICLKLHYAFGSSFFEMKPLLAYDLFIGTCSIMFSFYLSKYYFESIWFVKENLQKQKAELILLNEDLLESRGALEKVNTELYQFASCASHDMREPLRTISSFSSLLRSRLNAEDKNHELLFFVEDAAKRMTFLLDDLIHYTRVTQEKSSFEWIDLNQVNNEVQRNLYTKIQESGAEVESMVLPTVLANKTHMVLLFQNIISNAIKYRSQERSPAISIRWVKKDDFIVLLFKDNGIGIEEKYLKDIFEPFRRLHGIGKYEGSGIGLATCRKIVEHYNGSITATSEYGYSTTIVTDLHVQFKGQTMLESKAAITNEGKSQISDKN